MIVPYEKLSTEALRGLIEEFVTRPGTDTGYTEGSLEDNVEMVLMQLKLGDVLVVYDATLQTANLIPKDKLKEAGKTLKDRVS
jgi:uncharacterized protein YheU (UPF0270 family)